MWSTEGVTWHFYYYLVSYCTTCVQRSSDKIAKCNERYNACLFLRVEFEFEFQRCLRADFGLEQVY